MNLSKSQNNIINSKDDKILVIACPGSGKTHTLINKYLKLIKEDNVLPKETLLITFTKKSGNEMLTRLNNNNDIIPYHVGSIHSLSYKILKKYTNTNYTILDDTDISLYLLNIIQENKLNNIDIEQFKNIIDKSSTQYPINIIYTLSKDNLNSLIDTYTNLYDLYNKKKKKEHMYDFNDLMIELYKFLSSKKSIDFRNEIKYIFFDEYQDINSIQNDILLKFNESKLMLVGDDAQSIYSFRGSTIKYILEFKYNKYYLTENYRSSQHIINFCQNIISHNKNQYDKQVISKANIDGNKPLIMHFNNQNEQYIWIVNDIIKNNKKNVVILSRKNYLLNKIELELIKNKLNVKRNVGITLLDKEHIKIFIAFICILLNKKSSIHWKKLIELHIDEDLINTTDYITFAKTKLPLFYKQYQLINKIKIDIDKINNIIDYLKQFYSKNEIKDIKFLLNYLDDDLDSFVSNLYLNCDLDTHDTDIILLSTIHGAKGLEWDNVYIIDCSNKDFPSIKSKYYLNELEENEEERRLFYVAVSRARESVTITYHNKPSPLLGEIDTNLYKTNCEIKLKYDISFNLINDISNYIKNIGYYNIFNYLIDLKYEKFNGNINNYLNECQIINNYEINVSNVKSSINILCDNNKIIENINIDITVIKLIKLLLDCYLLKRNNIIITNIIIFNNLKNEITNFDVSNFNFSKFKNIIYQK